MKKFLWRIQYFLFVMVSALILKFSNSISLTIYMMVIVFIVSWLSGEYVSKTIYNSNHCPLTGIYNKNILKSEIPCLFEKLKKRNIPVSICMMDIDNFKKINDTKGHIHGDYILVLISSHIQNQTRKHDFLIRYGGDEFLLISPYTMQDEMKKLSERILAGLSSEISLSYGISNFPIDGNEFYSLIELSDKRMYENKSKKKNMRF